ncbi:hypothetical protein H9Y04_09685 [Streptomyces sp. TRM66268-LWL]|uniref:Uncharacterized protein n=1 Tax=Streptomyces polyasparticus TaxID=2767826 RepID=A0ABR7SEX0_9ACTN|nr:hypothetical protein [Streptomyces polyasparticus]MBC9712843.1 hypothetical protein [Streptomyces polyasparticus]
MDADYERFRERARWWRDTGLVLLVMAGGLWLWAGVSVVTSVPGVFGRCTDGDFSAARDCDADAIGLPLLLLVLSLPLAVGGAMLFATFAQRLVLREHLVTRHEPEDV